MAYENVKIGVVAMLKSMLKGNELQTVGEMKENETIRPMAILKRLF